MDPLILLCIALVAIGAYTSYLILTVTTLRKMLTISLIRFFGDDKANALIFLREITEEATSHDR